MKTALTAVLLIFIIGNITAVDIDSHQFIDHIRAITEPGKPEIFEDGVLFTASSSYRRVGISFAHESYAKVHWFRQLMVPRAYSELYVNGKLDKKIDPNRDSGIKFHMEPIPGDIKNMDYRLIIDGLWTTDPANPVKTTGITGVVESRVSLPGRPATQTPGQSGAYRFSYRAEPGEIVCVGGSFNNWDPFMYQLPEISPGFYALSLPLPPGSFQYLFFHRGEQIPDPVNPRKLYTREGNVISEAIVH